MSVTDEGTGIQAADLATIWEPFRRKGLSKEAVPGVGLAQKGLELLGDHLPELVVMDCAPQAGCLPRDEGCRSALFPRARDGARLRRTGRVDRRTMIPQSRPSPTVDRG